MIKKILGLVVLIIVVFSCSSCKNNDLELNEDLENMIKEDYFDQYGFELENHRFYGLYNESAVFFIPDATRGIKTVTISGLEFSYKSGWEIIVWKAGNFYNLENIETIFEEGILTQKDLKKIHSIHLKVSGNYY